MPSYSVIYEQETVGMFAPSDRAIMTYCLNRGSCPVRIIVRPVCSEDPWPGDLHIDEKGELIPQPEPPLTLWQRLCNWFRKRRSA